MNCLIFNPNLKCSAQFKNSTEDCIFNRIGKKYRTEFVDEL